MPQALSPHLSTCFVNGQILRKHRLVNENLWIVNGKIAPAQEKADIRHDMAGLIIAPGYIDLQVNGGFGLDFSKDVNCGEVISKGLLKHGVTSFLATLVSSSPASYKKLLPYLQNDSHVFGIHLEGPFLNPKQSGAHAKNCLQPLHLNSLKDIYGSFEKVKLVTLAPEIQGAYECIQQLKEKNIRVGAGHTNASYEEALECFKKGVGLVTHLFNAMTPMHHRLPGIALAALNTKGLYYSLILDGLHVHPAVVELAWKANPLGLVLISDSMSALGDKERKSFHLGEQEVEVKGSQAVLKGTDTLAGSILTLDQAVRNLREFTKCSIAYALEAATLKPAEVLGITHQKGTLNSGADADLIFLDEKLEVKGHFTPQSGLVM